ncbi:MAG: hypothetical protein G01um10148_408 [Parcubacteria group bacterium Gr01-1014_8]|nr:MAG: hypothetical protein G01um10148_408 [Parcubacteria group bacterium Gr01-1014_8]
MSTQGQWGLTVIRVGLAAVLLWFGREQLLHAADWIGYVPNYAMSLSGLPATTIVLANGSAEIAFGLLLFLGLFTRISAFVMGVHLALIAFSLGLNQIGVRDWGLAAALFGIALAGPGTLSIDGDASH